MGILPTYRTPRSAHRYSDGPLFGRLIARKLGRITTRWQQYVLDVGLERVDGPGSPFAYPDVVSIVGRRGGKTVTSMGVPLARAHVGPIAINDKRTLPFIGAHTAQNLIKARQRFINDLVSPYREHTSETVWRAGVNLREGIADTSLTIDPAVSGKNWRLPRASQIQVFAPTKSSVRGDGLFHLTFDEALVFTLMQGKDLLAAAGPTLSTLGGHGQIWIISNVTTKNDARTWLYDLREQGRAAISENRLSGMAYFEFTIPDNVDPLDESLWPSYYPGLSDGLVRVEEMRSDLRRLGAADFAAEYLGKWPGPIAVAEWMAIDHDVWDAAATATQQPADAAAALGLDIDPFGRSSTIVAATAHPDRPGALVEVIDHRPGSAWLIDEARARGSLPGVVAIGIDDYGPGREVLAELEKDPLIKAKLVPTKSPDFIAACYSMDAGLRESRVFYRMNALVDPLSAAAAAAQRTSGKGWQWERRVSVSQAPLVAATLAPWALSHAPEQSGFFVY